METEMASRGNVKGKSKGSGFFGRSGKKAEREPGDTFLDKIKTWFNDNDIN